MLYLSRSMRDFKTNDISYGVVDTDDDSETFISWSELKSAVLDSHLEIKGVMFENDVTGPYVSNLIPYQDERYLSTNQVKAKTLLGVDITVFRGIVTCIQVNGKVAAEHITLRLSDYGIGLASNTYIGCATKTKLITIILDDKIDADEFDFNQYYAANVCWDISEVSSDKIVNTVHWRLMSVCSGASDWNKYVIDGQGRIGWRL